MNIEHEIGQLEKEVRGLEIAYRRFLSGDPDQARPPSEMEDRIEQHVRRLRNQPMKRAVERFRFSNLEARFNIYREMYGRRLRAQEEGRVPGRRSGPVEVSHDPERGIVVGAGASSGATQALFEGLHSRSGRPMKMDLDTFRTYIDKQVASIRDKTGCDSVQFRLVSEGGKVKLKAKPIGRKPAG